MSDEKSVSSNIEGRPLGSVDIVDEDERVRYYIILLLAPEPSSSQVTASLLPSFLPHLTMIELVKPKAQDDISSKDVAESDDDNEEVADGAGADGMFLN